MGSEDLLDSQVDFQLFRHMMWISGGARLSNASVTSDERDFGTWYLASGHHTISPMSSYNKHTGQWSAIPSVLQPVADAGPSEIPPTMSIEADLSTTTPPGSPPDQAALGFSSEKPRPIKPARKRSPTTTPRMPQRPRPDDSPQAIQEATVAEVPEVPEAGPSLVPVRKVYPRKQKVSQVGGTKTAGKVSCRGSGCCVDADFAQKKAEKLLQYTNAYAPGL